MYEPTHENTTAKSPKSYIQAAHAARCELDLNVAIPGSLADFSPVIFSADYPTKQQTETRTKRHCTLVS